MLKTYLRLAFRQLVSHRLHSAINIIGLGVSLAIYLVLWSYVRFEIGFNSQYPKSDRIYEVQTSLYSLDLQPFTGHGVAPALKEAIPSIRNFLRTHWSEELMTLRATGATEKRYNAINILFADSSFFDFFPAAAIAGDVSTSLQKPFSVVLTKDLAARFFANPRDAIGAVIEMKSEWLTADFTVTAVVEDPPANTTIGYSGLLSIDPLLKSPTYRNDPKWNNFFTFLELERPPVLTQANSALGSFVKSYQRENNLAYEPEIFLQPVTDVHLSHRDPRQGRNLDSIFLFITISIVVLIIAWVNYVNLSTARAIERAKEVGVRKTIGVVRSQLVVQFLTEALVVNLMSVVMALLIAWMLMPALREITGKPIPLQFNDLSGLFILATLTLGGTLASGIYPAFLLSSFKPADVVKGHSAGKAGSFSLRKMLIVFQISASLVLLIGTSAIVSQVDFMQRQDKGLKTEQVLVIYGPEAVAGDIGERVTSFKNSLRSMATIEHVSTSGVVPGGSYNSETHMDIAGRASESTPGENVAVIFCDIDFVQTYGMTVIEGRPWDAERESDKKSVLINEASIIPFGLKTSRDAIQEKVVFGDDTLQIIGVVKNFYWESLKVAYRPVVIWPVEIYSRRISARINGDVQTTIERIEALYKDYFPGNEFNYSFAEDYYNRMYRSDKQFAHIFLIFSAFAMGIACLGLFGLTLFTTHQRSREISIRKVLGASIGSVVTLLTSQLGKLFLVAVVVSVPVSGLLVSRWLEIYPVRMALSAWLFVIPALLLLTIAFVSIIVQVYRAASASPASNLKV